MRLFFRKEKKVDEAEIAYRKRYNEYHAEKISNLKSKLNSTLRQTSMILLEESVLEKKLDLNDWLLSDLLSDRIDLYSNFPKENKKVPEKNYEIKKMYYITTKNSYTNVIG